MLRKVGVILVIVIALSVALRWLSMVFDVCFAALLVLFVYLLLKKRSKKEIK